LRSHRGLTAAHPGGSPKTLPERLFARDKFLSPARYRHRP
jgi:hypothetical protein